MKSFKSLNQIFWFIKYWSKAQKYQFWSTRKNKENLAKTFQKIPLCIRLTYKIYFVDIQSSKSNREWLNIGSNMQNFETDDMVMISNTCKKQYLERQKFGQMLDKNFQDKTIYFLVCFIYCSIFIFCLLQRLFHSFSFCFSFLNFRFFTPWDGKYKWIEL